MSSIRTLGMDALKHIHALSTLEQNLYLPVNLRPIACVYIMHIMKGTGGIEPINKHS
ncbi:uncharacterized protein B0T23DRAFT_349258 [Neurospora hispaniola]|uniref:Uncharacterized protein n=1 Tax=Neurospora hispaniola TaxID=588809 RepID=A0AAJ0MV03_9PEZI|nr:hypothetical protein B0T23DRAFT_349258 [Neurospora hispaniola]